MSIHRDSTGKLVRSPKLTVHLGDNVVRYLDRCRSLIQTDPTTCHVVTSAEVIRLAIHRLLLAMMGPMCDLAQPDDANWTEYLDVLNSLQTSGECPPSLVPAGQDARPRAVAAPGKKSRKKGGAT